MDKEDVTAGKVEIDLPKHTGQEHPMHFCKSASTFSSVMFFFTLSLLANCRAGCFFCDGYAVQGMSCARRVVPLYESIGEIPWCCLDVQLSARYNLSACWPPATMSKPL